MALSPYHKSLFNRLLQGSLSPEEAEEIISMMGNDGDPEVAELLLQHLQRQQPVPHISPQVTAALEARLPAILQSRAGQTSFLRPLPLYKRTWWRYAAAAVVILLAAGIWLLVKKGDATPVLNPAKPSVAALGNDIPPGRQGAILTLDDNRTIVLDTMNNGVIATQNGAKVLLDNGRLTYGKDGAVTAAVTYNTMTTPRGRQFQLLLPDGTSVWLDAASSIRYPTVFAGNERGVEITGEAYFEVAKDPSRPFKVKIKDRPTEIKVLGTHFNINAYNNESSINTTLLEGSVKVSGDGSQTIIKPGQQAQSAMQTRVISHVDLKKVMAWKEGVFDFGDVSLEEVMRQLERWYDIEVVYEKDIPPLEFVGKMGRDLTLSEVLRGLEVSEVRFRIEGRRLIVKP